MGNSRGSSARQFFFLASTLRAQILKNFSISLEIFNLDLENFNPALQNSPQKIGVWWVARLKIFFKIWALRESYTCGKILPLLAHCYSRPAGSQC